MPLVSENRLEAVINHWHDKLHLIDPVELQCQLVKLLLEALYLLSDLQLLKAHACLRIEHILVAS